MNGEKRKCKGRCSAGGGGESRTRAAQLRRCFFCIVSRFAGINRYENRREYWIADEYVFAPANYKPDTWFAGVGYDDTLPLPSCDRVPAREVYGLWAACAACGSTPGAEEWKQCKAVLAQTVAGLLL